MTIGGSGLILFIAFLVGFFAHSVTRSYLCAFADNNWHLPSISYSTDIIPSKLKPGSEYSNFCKLYSCYQESAQRDVTSWLLGYISNHTLHGEVHIFGSKCMASQCNLEI